VTLILDGAIFDRDEGGTLNAGEVQWMTAGSGVIHNEDVRTKGKMRLLQLWLTLPQKERWTEPGFRCFIPIRFLCATNPERRSGFTAVPLEVFVQGHETMCQ
jgi:hypothetical protein